MPIPEAAQISEEENTTMASWNSERSTPMDEPARTYRTRAKQTETMPVYRRLSPLACDEPSKKTFGKAEMVTLML